MPEVNYEEYGVSKDKMIRNFSVAKDICQECKDTVQVFQKAIEYAVTLEQKERDDFFMSVGECIYAARIGRLDDFGF